MEERIADYNVFPSVVESGVESEILIQPRGDHASFCDGTDYEMKFVPMECCNVSYELSRFAGDFNTMAVRSEHGCIRVRYRFEEEQEWSVIIQEKENPSWKRTFHIYSVFKDLVGKKAFKGDFHSHSNRSDGNEAPAIVTANYRKAGFDFMAITDHYRWKPSKEAIDIYKNVDIDLKLFLGEEVHVPGNYIHAINFGGKFSLNELYENNKEEIDSKINEMAEKLSVPAGINALEYAYRKWIADNIRESGGLSILVHPFWICCDEYNMQTKMTDYLFETNCFDAFEVLGGQSIWENNMQTALYNEERAKGRKIPIVGSSDSHGTEPPVWFNTIKTVLISEDLKFERIYQNIKELYSAAVETAGGECYRVDGPYRIVKYALFLLRYYFPRHDELCYEEGRLMKDYVCGNQEAKAQLSQLSGRTEKFAKQFFGW